MLFEDIIFGPIKSRRLGTSLGINLLPTHQKYCTFDCVYCECGWNEIEYGSTVKLHSLQEIEEALLFYLTQQKPADLHIDSLTFAGNGEPSIHPEFSEIMDMVRRVRDQYLPNAQITILSNASRLYLPNVFDTLQKVDNPVLKLDAGSEKMFYAINKPAKQVDFKIILDNLKKFGKKAIIQTLFFKGECDGVFIDNTSGEELELWLKHIQEIAPRSVMLYSLDRATPAKNLIKLNADELEAIAAKVRALGIEAKVFG